MSHTITIRLPEEVADWLREVSRKTGIPQGRIVREQLEKARENDLTTKKFMSLAGSISGPADLSLRKGFAESAGQ